MAFSLDRKCPRLIDFFYNHAELVSGAVWSVVGTLSLVAFLIIAPEDALAALRGLQIGYKVLICALTVIGWVLLMHLTYEWEYQKEQHIKRLEESRFDGERKLYDSHIQILRERVEKARQEAEMLRHKEQAPLDRQVRLFNRLSLQERKCLLNSYVDKEKNFSLDSGDPSTRKLWMQRYIIEIGLHSYCLSNKTCDLFDARYEELKAQLTEDEASDPADSNTQDQATSSEDMHPDAVIARKYAEGDPETIRKLSIFDP